MDPLLSLNRTTDQGGASTTSHKQLGRMPGASSGDSDRFSLDSAAFDSDAEEDPFSHDMDSSEAHRRRKARMLARSTPGDERQHGKAGSKPDKRMSSTHSGFADEGHISDALSISSSDDVELDHLASDGGLTEDEESGLTRNDRQQRKKRRRRDTDLDARIGGNSQPLSAKQKLANRNVIKALGINTLLVLSWYLFSLSISIYNKWMFSPKYLDFHFPLFVTCLHMFVQFCLASLVLYFVPHLRPRSDSISNPHDDSRVRKDTAATDKPLMTKNFYLTRIGPCGAATGLDIGLGNMSLKFITLTFYTMCKSSSLAFVLVFAFLFRLETPSVKLVAIIVTMTIGVIMMVAGEVAFDILGFVLVILAAFFSGFRWSLTQILLLRSPATSNPFSSIFFLAPVMFLSLAIIAIPVEGFSDLGHGLTRLLADKGGLFGICILVFPGLLAFLMTASEFALLQRTSVVTLSICGIFKEVVTISAAGIVYHDPLTPINVSGLLVTIVSIAAYNYLKINKMRQDANKQAAEGRSSIDAEDMNGDHGAAEPMLSSTKHTNGNIISPSKRSAEPLRVAIDGKNS